MDGRLDKPMLLGDERVIGATGGVDSPMQLDHDKSTQQVHKPMQLDGDDVVEPTLKRAPEWETHIVRPYHMMLFYNVDFDRNLEYEGRPPRELDYHYQRATAMTDFFATYTTAETIDVHFDEGSTNQDWKAFWEEQKPRMIGATLVFIYFNGRAVEQDEKYGWKIRGIREPVNALELFNNLNTTNADFTYLLDCYIHTRWCRTILKRREGAMTEMILAGRGPPDRYGNQGEIRDGDFAASFTRLLSEYCHGRPEKGASIPRGFKMQSTPQLMRFDKTLLNNCLRIWLNRSNGRQTNEVREIWRIKIDPQMTWHTGKLYFCGVSVHKKLPDEWTPSEEEDDEAEVGEDGSPSDEGIVPDIYDGASGTFFVP